MTKMAPKETIIQQLETVFDPEFRVDVWNLGLVYGFEEEGADLNVKMTLTTPTCPAAGPILAEVKHKLSKVVEGEVKVNLTFEPPWRPEMITKKGRRMLPSAIVDFLEF